MKQAWVFSQEWLAKCMKHEPVLAEAVASFRSVVANNRLQIVGDSRSDYSWVTFLVDLNETQRHLQAIIVEARWWVENGVALCRFLSIPGMSAQEQSCNMLVLLTKLVQSGVFAQRGISKVGLEFCERPTMGLSIALQKLSFAPLSPGFIPGYPVADTTQVWWASIGGSPLGLTLR